MPRKLKTFVTESGFFELAVAAPSMKAALHDWGIEVNLFQQGLARLTDDPGIVAATAAVPGTVLRRPIGSKEPFREDAALPKVKGRPASKLRHSPGRRSQTKSQTKTRAKSPAKSPEKSLAKSLSHSRDAVDLHAIRQVRAALEAAEARHRKKIAALDKKRDALERLAEREQKKWAREKEKLEEAIARLKR